VNPNQTGRTLSGNTIRWSDFGSFSVIPEWILDAEISDRAIRLFAVLGRYADRNGQAMPGRKTLAERLKCSLSSLDRALEELRDIGALSWENRRHDDRSLASNEYILHPAPAGVASPVKVPTVTGEGRGSVTGDAIKNENQELTREPPLESPLPMKVDRRPVSVEEGRLALDVLAEWNAQTGQNLRSKDWLAKFVMRIRERPDLTLVDHAHIIAAALADPWWKGQATPSVVYGSGAQFERSILTAENKPRIEKPPSRRYGYGVSAAELLERARQAEREGR
jgi:hypothetical protein